MSDNWITMKEACLSLDMSEATVRRHVKQGKLKSKVENGRRLILVQSDDQPTQNDDQMTIGMSGLVEQLKAEVEHLRSQVDDQNEQIKRKDEQMAEASERSDTIVLQLTRQLEQSQRLLEHHQEPWYRRWFRKRGRQDEGRG